jgi:predicted protein tyrosine phosphatase
MHLLFICSFGRDRSATAAALYHGQQGIAAQHAGVHRHAVVPLTAEQIRWADQIVCFTAQHVAAVRRTFGAELAGKPIVCLDIENRYARGSAELVARIRHEMQRVLSSLQGISPTE